MNSSSFEKTSCRKEDTRRSGFLMKVDEERVWHPQPEARIQAASLYYIRIPLQMWRLLSDNLSLVTLARRNIIKWMHTHGCCYSSSSVSWHLLWDICYHCSNFDIGQRSHWLAVGLFLLRLVIWSWNPNLVRDDALPLKIILDEHHFLPTCNKRLRQRGNLTIQGAASPSHPNRVRLEAVTHDSWCKLHVTLYPIPGVSDSGRHLFKPGRNEISVIDFGGTAWSRGQLLHDVGVFCNRAVEFFSLGFCLFI